MNLIGWVTSPWRDIQMERWAIEKWADADRHKQLIELYKQTETETLSAITWYKSKKRAKAFFSRFLRTVAIAASVAGGMMPVLAGVRYFEENWLWDPNLMSQSGYIMIAGAAACILIDKFFGTSSGWIRYIVTALGIERTLIEFRATFAMKLVELGGAEPKLDETRAFHTLALDMRKNVQQQVQNETAAWAQEFQQSTAELEKLVSQQRQTAEAKMQELRTEARTGAINLSIECVGAPEAAVEVFIDDSHDKATAFSGKTGSVKEVAPGHRKVTIRTQLTGGPVEASRTVMVEPGSIKELVIKL